MDKTCTQMQLNRDVAKRIKNARIKKNMTQLNLADEIGVSYQAVSKWERGISMPYISKLHELCGILEISVDYLLSGDEAAKTNSQGNQA